MSECAFCGEFTEYKSPDPLTYETSCVPCAKLWYTHIRSDNIKIEVAERLKGYCFGKISSASLRHLRSKMGLIVFSPPTAQTLFEAVSAIMYRLSNKFHPALSSQEINDTAGDKRLETKRLAAFIARHTELGTEDDRAILLMYATDGGNVRSNTTDCKTCEKCSLFVFAKERCACGKCMRCEPRCEYCKKCDTCCRCPKCASCQVKQTSKFCKNCDNCRSCCKCPRCASCGVSGTALCSDCFCCEGRHCRCTIVHSIKNQFSPWTDAGKRLAGLEIEFNQCSSEFTPVTRWAKRWHAEVHEDGSCGWECVTSPAAGRLLTKQIIQLGEAMETAGAAADERCGVHVHVDARDLNLHAIRRLSYVYGLVEPILYAVAGQNRVGQHYCQPNGVSLKAAAMDERLWSSMIMRAIYRTSSKASTIAKLKYNNGSGRKRGPGKKDGARYAGMNLCPWVSGRINRAMDTTVEFRIHRNCLSASRLTNWASLCVALVDYAKHSKWEDVINLPKDAARAICIVAPAQASWVVNRLSAWRSVVRRNRRTINYKLGNGWSLKTSAA